MDNAAFMDDFFCQVSVATKNVGQQRMNQSAGFFFRLNMHFCLSD